MKKKNIIIISGFAILVFAVTAIFSVIYLQQVFVPKKLKPLILESISDSTGRQASIGDLKFSILKGVTIDKIKIYEQDGQTEFLSIQKASFKILIFPILKEKKIFIPTIYIDSPVLRVSRDQQKVWNFSTLELSKKKEKKGENYSLLLYQIKIANLQVLFKDSGVSPVFETKIDHASASVAFQIPFVKYQITGQIQEIVPAKFSVKGSYNFITKSSYNVLSVKDFSVEEYPQYYSPFINFQVKQGNVGTLSKIWYDSHKNLALNIYCPIGNIHIIGKNLEAFGNGVLKGQLNCNLAKKDSLKYQGQFSLESAVIKNIPYVTDLRNVNGNILFTQAGLSAQKLTGIAYENNVFLEGTLLDYSDPKIDINLKSEKFDLAKAYNSLLPNMDPSFGNLELTGMSDIHLNIKGQLRDPKTIMYNSEIKLQNCGLKEKTGLYNVDKINGNVSIQDNTLTAPNLTAYFNGQPVNAAVTLKDFNDPSFSVSVKTKIDLENLKNILSQNIPAKLKDLNLDGDADTSLNITGKFKPQFSWDASGTIGLTDGLVKAPDWKEPFKNILGVIAIKNKDNISTEKLSFTYGQTNYTLAGTLTSLQQPSLNFSLAFPDFYAVSQIIFDKNTMQVKKCDGKYLNSTFSVIGEVSDLKNLLLNLYGNVSFNLQDLDNLFPNRKQMIQNINPQGIIALSVYLKGTAKSIKDSEMVIKGQSGKITAWNIQFLNPYIDLRMADRKIQVPKISAAPYGGSLGATATMDLNNDKVPFNLDVDVLDVDLSQWVKDSTLKNKDIEGSFNAKMGLKGDLGDPASYNGDGWVRVRDGYLWEVPVLTGLAEVLYLTTSDRVIFKEAYGTFTIADKQISTKDLSLYSDVLKLVGVGYLDFDDNLNFDVNVNFAEGLAQKSPLTKLGSILVTTAGEFIGEIKITGTLKEPKYKLKMFPIDKILKNQIIDKIKGIFQHNQE